MSSLFSSLETILKYAKNKDDLDRLIVGLQKIKRCADGVEQGLSLSDIIHDQQNFASLKKIFGDQLDAALLAIANFSFEEQNHKSIVLNHGIPSRRASYLYRALGGWKQFQVTLVCKVVDEFGGIKVQFVNTSSRSDWEKMDDWVPGSLVSIYLRTVKGEVSADQEIAAIEKIMALLDAVQFINDEPINTIPKANLSPKKGRTRSYRSSTSERATIDYENPIFEFSVKVNKLDTFVHAGNASLIARLVRLYSGQVRISIQREKLVTIPVDPDSIWAAAIKNGETMTYQFFGVEKPSEDFIKELGQITNKYTQMDKVG